MRWLENFTLVMRSSITTLRERIADPERLLHQLVCDMEEELETVRASVAAAIADEIQMGRRAQKAGDEAATWSERATAALTRGDEALARSALEQKVQAAQRADTLRVEHEKQKEQTAKLQQSVRDLEDKIRQARQKQTLLLARMARADSARRINRALDRSEGCSAFSEFRRLEERVERSEAMSEAYDRMEGRDPDAEELARRFDEAQRREQVQNELEELKRRVSGEST